MIVGKAYAAAITGPSTSITSIGQLVSSAMVIVYGVVGIALFAYFVYGGYLWLTSTGNPDKIKKATDTMLNAVIGTIIVVFAYLATTIVSRFLGFNFGIF